MTDHQGHHQSYEGDGNDVVVYLCNDDSHEQTLELVVRGTRNGHANRHEFALAADEERAIPVDTDWKGGGISIQVQSVDGVAMMEFDPDERPAPVVVVREGTVMIVPVSNPG